MSWPAAHPGPWRLDLDEVECFTDQPILDANGEPVVVTDSGVYPPGPETARFIVAAVNERDRLRAALERIAGHEEGIVGCIESGHASGIDWDGIAFAMIQEARAALGEGGQA